jgi:hypothetical protein
MGMRPRNIEVNIEELVLDSFAGNDRKSIVESVERELTRLFTEQGVPPSLNWGREIECLDGGGFEVAQGSKPEAIGAKVAKAVYGGLNK